MPELEGPFGPATKRLNHASGPIRRARAEKPGLIDAENTLRDLSGEIADIAGAVLSREGLAKLRALDPKSLPKTDPSHRLGAPVAGTRNFVAVGRNYAEHAAETGSDVPEEPLLFNKACPRSPARATAS